MADSVSLIYRGIGLEDLLTSATPAPVNVPVLNVGPSIPVTPIVAAASDAAATAAGLAVGTLYMNNGGAVFFLQANGGSGAGIATKLTGTLTAAAGAVANASAVVLGSTIAIAGVNVGDAVSVGVSPALVAGVMAIGKVTASGVVTVEVWNLSGGSVTVGSAVYTALVIH